MEEEQNPVEHIVLIPSLLPDNTVIKDEDHGLFFKDGVVWFEMFGHCGDCAEVVRDDGNHTHSYASAEPEVYIPTPSDQYFKDFKVLSMPVQNGTS